MVNAAFGDATILLYKVPQQKFVANNIVFVLYQINSKCVQRFVGIGVRGGIILQAVLSTLLNYQ